MARLLRYPRWRAAALVVAVALFISPSRAPGEIKVWVGGTGNWTNIFNWSPNGAPNQGDDCFLVQSDNVSRTVTYNDTSSILREYRTVRMDSTGSGLMTLTQTNPATFLHSEFLYVGNAATGAYNLSAGAGTFGVTELRSQGSLTVSSAATFTSGSFLQAGGSVSALTDNFRVPGTYTYNAGNFTGNLNVGTFINNVGTFAGFLDISNRLILGGSGNGTFLGSVINRGPFTLPFNRRITAASDFSQIGSTFTQAGTISVDRSTIVGGGGTWLQQGATHTGDDLFLGTAQGGGTYSISGNSQLTLDGVLIGITGHGTFLQSSGVVSISGGVIIRGTITPIPSRMYWNMSGGTLLSGGAMLVGWKEAISGTFIQSGGFAQVRNLIVNQDAATVASAHLSGGTLMVQEASVNHGTFTQTGGSSFFAGNLDGAGSVSVTGDGLMSVRRLRQNSVHVGGNGRIVVGVSSVPTATHRVQSLTFEQAGNNVLGAWDLGATNLVIDYGGASPIADIRKYLASGYAGGDWNGTGLRFTLVNAPQRALGYAEASDVLGQSGGEFGGTVVDSTAILIRLTRYGDANLDGVVNLADFNRLAGNFGGSNKHWSQGDFNYDGLVNLADFNRLAGNFGLSASGPEVTPQDWSNLASAIPEPASIGILMCALALVNSRRACG